MKEINPRVYWLLLAVAFLVFLLVTAAILETYNPGWRMFLFGLLAGELIGAAAFCAAIEPEDDWEITFKRGCKPIIRRIRRPR